MKFEDPNFKQFSLDGFNVYFPFEPYDCQKEMIKTILKGLNTKTNSIVESPTGTGKCLSALSAIFAFLGKSHEDKSYLAERRKLNSIIEILMKFEELRPNLEKLNKNFKIMNKSSSVSKILEELKEILLSNPDEDDEYSFNEIDLNSFFVKCDEMIKMKNKIIFIIANKVLQIFKNFSYEAKVMTEVENKFSSLIELIDIAKNKLKDQLKLMKYSHSVLYTVRTSSQIDIVYEEFEKIKDVFKNFNFSYLKSRNFFCINNELSKFKGTAKSRICKKKCKKENECKYFQKYKEEKEIDFKFDPALKKYKKEGTCPYFSEIRNAKFSDMTVCTYNYLFNKVSREDILGYLVNPIIVIDEAHNVVNACEEFLNFKLSLEDLIGVLENVFDLYEKVKKLKVVIDEPKAKTIKFLQTMKQLVCFLLVLINSLIFFNQNSDLDFSYKKYDFNNTFIFKVMSMLLSVEKFKVPFDNNNFYLFQDLEDVDDNNWNNFNKNEDEYEETCSCTCDENEICKCKSTKYTKGNKANKGNKGKNQNRKEEINSLLQIFNDTIMNKENRNQMLLEFSSINYKNIDVFETEIKNFDKVINMFHLLFSTLFSNFEKFSLSNSDQMKRAYIEDYYLTVNIVELNALDKEDKVIVKHFEEYQKYIFKEGNNSFYNIIKNCMNMNKSQPQPAFSLIDDSSFDQLKNSFIFTQKFLTEQTKHKFEAKYINLICMNPAICFQKMKHELNPLSIILISGTLNPFEYYSNQLGVDFKNQLENAHIVDKSNLNVFIFDSSVINQNPIEISFTKNNSEKYNDELYIETVNIIHDFSRNSGCGTLIFIKTYSMLNELVKILISRYKELKFEVKQRDHFIEITKKGKLKRKFFLDSKAVDSSVKNTIMTNYKKSCKSGNKSYLISVMRGMFSEGVNFDDEESSMIYVLGIPYPDITDDFVRLKKNYLTFKYKRGASPFNGDEWYNIQAMTAFNQALGRAIRRKDDFSTICLLESRVHNAKIFNLISKWLRKIEINNVTRYAYTDMKNKNKDFYQKFLTSKQESEDEIENELLNNSVSSKSVGLKNISSNFKLKPVGNNSGFVTFSFKK